MEVAPGYLYGVAAVLAQQGVEYSAVPKKLRAGGESHWYIDVKQAMDASPTLWAVGRLALAKTAAYGVEYSGVCGMGIGGDAFCQAMVVTAGLEGVRLFAVTANENKSPDQRYGYGLHGERALADRALLLVDDVATTGHSLVTTLDMLRPHGPRVTDALVVVDRSNGKAAQALAEHGVQLHSLFQLDEIEGLIPTM